VEHLARAGALNGLKQFSVDQPVVSQLVLRHMDDDDTDLKLGKVLLELKAAIESKKHIKIFLGERKKGPVFQGVPTLLVDSRNLVITQEKLDAWIYALVNEDAHSRS
jgi:hypothetical protein